MKRSKTILSLLCAICLCLACSINVNAQSEEEMKAWQKAMTPSEPHAMMAKYAGDWNYKMKTWMDPTQSAQESEGTTKSKMVLGGRYLQSKHSGMSFGMPFEGMGLSAYDNMSGEYITTWVDNMGTGVMVFKGKADEDGKVKYWTEFDNPMTKQKEKHIIVNNYTDADNYTMEYYVKKGADGEKAKVMEIAYSRAK